MTKTFSRLRREDAILYFSPAHAVGLTKSNKNNEILFKKMSNNELSVTQSVLSTYYYDNGIAIDIENNYERRTIILQLDIFLIWQHEKSA